MKTETWLRIIFGALVLPGMMFLFPLGDWLASQPGSVLVYVLWLYGVLVMGRKVLGPMLLQEGRAPKLTAAGVFFLMAVVTFLMSLSPVALSSDVGRVGQLQPHVRAIWVLFLAVSGYAIPVGYLSARVKVLSKEQEEEEAASQETEALESRRSEASEEVLGGEIRVTAGYKTLHLPLSAIQYIEGRNNYACFHLDHMEDVVSQISLKSVMGMLPEGKFVRIHRSYIVPLWRIEKRSGAQVHLVGVKEPFPVGRAYKANLKNV